MKQKILILLIVLCVSNLHAQVPATPVAVVVDSVSTGLYQLNTVGQMISTAQNTLQAIEYQKQSMKSLSEGDLEGYSDFMAYQSLSTGCINASIDNYKNSEALIKFGLVNTKSPDIYNKIVSGEEAPDGKIYKNVDEELETQLNEIEDAEWTSSKVLADIDDYVMKTRLRQQQMRRINKQNTEGEVDNLQKMTQILGVMADQNEDTIQLLYTQNLYEGTKAKLKQQQLEHAKAQARARGEMDAAYYEDFGKGLFGEGNLDIVKDIENELEKIEKRSKKRSRYGL